MAMGVMTVSAFGLDGTVTDVTIKSDGTMLLKVGTTQKTIVGTPEAQKAMFATALTAKTSGATVTVIGGSYNGDNGWIVLKLQ